MMCSSCGEGDKLGENPLLQRSWDTPFGVVPFEKVRAEHYLEAFRIAFEEQDQDVASIVDDPQATSFESVIVALDRSGGRLRELRDLFEMSEAAISDESYRAVSDQLSPLIAEADDRLWMNQELFLKVRDLYQRRGKLDLTPEQMRLLELTNNRFKRGGAMLIPEQRERLAQINGELATLTTRYGQNLLAETEANYLLLETKELDGIPNEMRNAAKREAKSRGYEDGELLFPLRESVVTPILIRSNNRDVRERIYKAYRNRGANGGESDNREIVRRVSELRQERAQMLGYENHAEYVISQQMAGRASEAYALLDTLWAPALKRAIKDRDDLQRLLRKDKEGNKLEAWDWLYYAEKQRDSRYKVTNESVAPYLSLEMVRGGAFALANRLYGITIRPTIAPIYSDDCEVYEVIDRDNSHLGLLYFDLYPRSGKGQGAWCGNLREQSYDDNGERIAPVVSISCNFPRAEGSTPTLLTIDQVETLFHEFGHALHFIFQDVKYRGLASVEGDFVEFPSQLMENWALDPALMRMYAVHYRTGKPLSDLLIRRISESRSLNQSYEILSVASAALLDLDLQSTTDLSQFDVESFTQEALSDRRELIPQIKPRYELYNFPHLFTYDYSAGYYFYLWSEVLDKDCYAAFRESGDIFSKRLADRLRSEILRRGGEADGVTLYRNFRGDDPSIEWLLKSKGLDR